MPLWRSTSPTSGEFVVCADFNADKEIWGDDCNTEDDDIEDEDEEEEEDLEDMDLHTATSDTGSCNIVALACKLLTVSLWSSCAQRGIRHSWGCIERITILKRSLKRSFF